MNNPWESISLSDYENHMSLGSVGQLQKLNLLMKAQLSSYPVSTALILGVAGGNGLEHIDPEKYRAVYGVDINGDYLRATGERFPGLSDVLRLLRIDLLSETDKLPRAQLLIADLLIEYIGFEAFKKAVMQAAPEYVSCVIQINTGEGDWVSDSPYLHAFDGLDAVHHLTEEDALTAAMKEIGYSIILRGSEALPNGKALLRLDYRKQGVE
ncbi:MAG: methyltransferase type 11 [Ruminococcus sp.]|nr:methyltransferase type 11 [Ruminococcus sp.]